MDKREEAVKDLIEARKEASKVASKASQQARSAKVAKAKAAAAALAKAKKDEARKKQIRARAKMKRIRDQRKHAAPEGKPPTKRDQLFSDAEKAAVVSTVQGLKAAGKPIEPFLKRLGLTHWDYQRWQKANYSLTSDPTATDPTLIASVRVPRSRRSSPGAANGESVTGLPSNNSTDRTQTSMADSVRAVVDTNSRLKEAIVRLTRILVEFGDKNLPSG